jgi:hypothetical protein
MFDGLAENYATRFGFLPPGRAQLVGDFLVSLRQE